MFELAKAWYDAKLSAYKATAAGHRAVQEASEELAQYVSDESGDGWRPTTSQVVAEGSDLVTERPGGPGWSSAALGGKGHSEADQHTMVVQARKFFRQDPHARAALMNVVKYLMGRGVTITPKSKDPRVWHIWREFWTSDRNKMELRQFELPMRAFRDGNVLLHFFSKDDDGKGTWKSTVRFLDPLHLAQPPAELAGGNPALTSMGVLVDPDDPETAVAYFFKDPAKPTLVKRIDAEEVHHIKIFADSDQKLGESFLQPIMDLFVHYRQWLHNRIVLNKVRTAIVLIKKIEGTSADVSRLAQTLKTSSVQEGSGSDKKQGWKPGTQLVANAGVSYEMLSPNINAADAAEDGRNMKLGMAAGTGQPEYAFGDASNSNFASTMVAESPFVKEIQYWQKFFETHWQIIFKRVIMTAVDAGVIEEPDEEDPFVKYAPKDKVPVTEFKVSDKAPEDPENPENKDDTNEMDATDDQEGYQETEREKFYGCDVQWPEIVHRDFKQTTEAVISAKDAGLISDPTAAATLGFDYSEEVRKQQQVHEEAGKKPNPFMSQADDGMDMLDAFGKTQVDDEAKAIMQTLTPDEKAKISGMKDKGAVAKFLLNRSAGRGSPVANGK